MGLIPLIISVICFIAFVSYVAIKYGVQKSISDSYYRFREDDRSSWFSIGIASFAFPVFYIGGSIFMMLASACICFIAAASAFEDRLQTKIVHYVGAVLGIMFGLTDIIVTHGYWVPILISILLAVIIKYMVRNYIWWIELLAYFTIISCKFVGIIPKIW